MTIQFNVTGADRKKLVGAISTALNAPTNYKGAPTFAYEIGEYSIDKTGTVTGPDNRDLIDILAEHHGFAAAISEYDSDSVAEAEPGTVGTEEAPDIDQHNPGRYCNPNVPPTEEMLRQAEAWMEGQPAFEDLQLTEREELGLGREVRRRTPGRDPVGEDGPQPSDVPEQDDVVIEMPLEGFTPEAIDNLCKLVQSKEVLIKKALGAAELPIQVLEDRIAFPWFKADGNIDPYAQFIAALCKTAKEKKRVTAKAQESFENEKFAMRVWLIGLGLIGKDYSLARKLLMANLDGNSGFRYGQGDAASNVRSGGEARAKKLTIPLNETAEQRAKRELIQLWTNTDKRREFLKSHREWGIWITTPELGLTYYRYDLPDGGRILAMEYQRENPYTLSGEEGLQTITTYYLWDGEHFTPHSASEYTIIERLKNLKAALQKELCAAVAGEPAPAADDTTPAEEPATAPTEAATGEEPAPAPADAAPVEDGEVQGDE